MNKELFESLDILERERHIPKAYMAEKIEAALTAACRKELGTTSVTVILDFEKMDMKVYRKYKIVAEVEDPSVEITKAGIEALEKEYESNIFGDNSALLNKAWRSVGIMEYGSTLTEAEMLSLISNIRLTHCLGCSDKLPYYIDIASLNTLQTELMNTYIYSEINADDVSKEGCDKERARRLNEYIKALRMREVV